MTNGVGEPWGAHILKIKHNYRHLGKDVELDIVESLKLVRDVGLVLRGATAALREGACTYGRLTSGRRVNYVNQEGQIISAPSFCVLLRLAAWLG